MTKSSWIAVQGRLNDNVVQWTCVNSEKAHLLLDEEVGRNGADMVQYKGEIKLQKISPTLQNRFSGP